MKLLHVTATAFLCAALSITVAAEEAPGDAGLQFDFNNDGVTDASDWEALRTFSQNYQMSDDSGNVFFANQEVPATLTLLLDEQYGNRAVSVNEVDLSEIPEYYLPP